VTNQTNRPPLTLPPRAAVPPPPPPVANPNIPADFASLIEKYPLPWVVGPRGDVWVAADVEAFDPDKEASVESVRGPNGTFWRTTKRCLSTIGRPRLVAETSELEDAHRDTAAFLVFAANQLRKV